MFYEYLATNLASFEKGVHKILWERTSERPEIGATDGIPLVDLVMCYRRLIGEYAKSDTVRISIQIDDQEAWVGVYCTDFELGMFYHIERSGEERVWITKKAGEPQKRIRSVFGDPLRTSSHHFNSDGHITNRLAPGGHLVYPYPQPVGMHA